MTIRNPGASTQSPPVPVRHRRKVPFVPRVRVSSDLEASLTEIRKLDDHLGRYFVPPTEFRSRIEEIVSSNLFESVRLEGNPLSLDEVRRITRKSLSGAGKVDPSPPIREIANHLAIWLMPEELAPPWTIETLTALHRELLGRVDPKAFPGRLRSRASAIYSDEGEELFITAPPDAIRPELESLLEWVNQTAPAMDPIVSGALFFHEFESIHPFEEGNGRTGRVLFHAYLQNHGLEFAYRARIEVELLRDPEAYYRALSWTDYTGDYAPLLAYFTEACRNAYREASEWFRRHDVTGSLDPMAARILSEALSVGDWFNLRDARSWVPQRGDQTIRSRVNELTGLGYLESKGNTRARVFRFADPFSAVRDQVGPLRQGLGLKPIPRRRSLRA